MCGILGQFTTRSSAAAAPAEAVISHIASLMDRRGPDQAGLWNDGKGCILAFRRLSILDISEAGNQPMLTEDGRYALVFNGELYNFRALRSTLEQQGAVFHSDGDTEVVLQALVHWGVDALSRFNGMFALGFYDGRAQRLILARDHAGIKPLYYLRCSEGLVFASQYDQLLAHPWSRPHRVSPSGLALCLRMGRIPEPYALLESTHMLESGSWLEISRDDVLRQGRFFELPRYQEPDLQGEEAWEAVHAAVAQAVQRQLVSDVPLGAFLSGGIDSPLIAATMKSAGSEPVKTFTIGTQGDGFDESPAARAYAETLGVESYVRQVTPAQTVDLLDEVVDACGEPMAEYGLFPALMVAKLAREQVKVVLSGDGGDELFWGYVDRFAAVMQASDMPSTAAKTMDMQKLFAMAKRHRAPGVPTNLGEWYRRIHHQIPEHWLQRIFPDLPPWPADYAAFHFDSMEADRTAQWLRWNEYRTYMNMILQKMDRASMYHSLEVRVPFLDREVIDTALRVDWRSCLDCDRRIGKVPLRKALARYIPQPTQAKRGFTVPMGAWLRGPLRPVFEGVVLGRTRLLSLPMQTAVVQELFNEHLSGKAQHELPLWTLLSFALWEDRRGGAL